MAPPTVIENVRIHTMDGEVIERGTIVIRGRRVAEVGVDLVVPARARRIDGTGLTATPGLIDVNSMLGLSPAASGGNNPTALAADDFDRYDTRAIAEALRNGVTSIAVGARGHTGFGPVASVMRLTPDGDGFGEVFAERLALTLNMRSDAAPLQRLQQVDNIRSQLRAAQRYQESLEEYEKKLKEFAEKIADEKPENAALDTAEHDPHDDLQQPPRRRPQQRPQERPQTEQAPQRPDQPTRNRRNDVLLEAMAGKLPVMVRADRSEDILNALEIAGEFGLRLVIQGGAEAHLVARQLSDAGVPVILDPLTDSMLPRSGSDPRRAVNAAAILQKAGVAWSIGSGGQPGEHTRHILAAAQLLVQHAGIDTDPLELVTSRAAGLLKQDDRIGRLSNGMQADIVLWTGDPLDPASKVNRVLISGTTVYERAATEEEDA